MKSYKSVNETLKFQRGGINPISKRNFPVICLMSRYRIWVYGAILFVLTVTILFTQVSWLLQSARIEESFLNQRINMALCKSMDILSKDRAICTSFESCSAREAGTFEFTLTKQKKQKIDSVILEHLNIYNIDVPFKTTFTPYTKGHGDPLQANQALLFPVAVSGLQNILVRIEIPSKSELIRAQINGTFILSIVFLGLLIWMFISTLRRLNKERNIRTETVDFINTMAHDLKTPISNISLATSMLIKDRQDNQYLSIIDSEIAKLRQRSRQILGLASVNAVLHEEANKVQVDVHELINQTLESFSLKLSETKGEVITKLQASSHTVSGNLVQLTSAIMNIVDNAFTYSSGSPVIQVRTENQNQSIRIDIEDNGPGIPPHERELIFTKGYRINNGYSKTEGYGLGLYLSKTFIEKQGGTLSLSSNGNGSLFSIELPVR
jgi:two-component system phosphate regulon sensor histidine kinase PhoR